MGRKKKATFEWVAEDEETPPEVDDELVYSRADEKRRRRRMKTLAEDMQALSPKQRKALPMDEELREALEALVVAGKTPDRRRKLLRMKSLLAEEPPEVIEALLAAIATA